MGAPTHLRGEAIARLEEASALVREEHGRIEPDGAGGSRIDVDLPLCSAVLVEVCPE
jgi:hypothetical protein